MLKNYITIAWRNLIRNKGFSSINILGLAAGLAICLLIVLFIMDEFHYDRFHENHEDIYRIIMVSPDGSHSEGLPAPVGEMLEEYVPGLEAYSRFRKQDNLLIQRAFEPDFMEYEDGFLYAEHGIFNLFTYEFLRGDPVEALQRPFTVVLTESMSLRYFGSDDPMGKILLVDGEFEFEVTGIVKDPPRHSGISFQFLASYSTLIEQSVNTSWTSLSYPTYLRLPTGEQLLTVTRQLQQIASDHAPEWIADNHTFELEPLADIYLFSEAGNRLGPKSDIRYIYIFLSITLVILLVACINYVNLSTAHALKRSREVGVRKTAGASRKQLVFQFMGEAFLISLFAVMLAVVLVEFLLPAFNRIVDKDVSVLFNGFSGFWLVIPGFILLTGLLSGLYPAFVLSGQKTVRALKGSGTETAKKFSTRKVLVVFQFTISIALIIGTIVIQSQLAFIQERDLGLNEQNVVVVPFLKSPVADQPEAFKRKLLQHPQIRMVSFAGNLPPGASNNFAMALDEHPTGRMSYGAYTVDEEFVKTLGIEMIDGMDLPAFTEEGTFALVNETLVRYMDWELDDAVGLNIPRTWGDRQFTIRGVFRNFHFESLHQEIEPLVLMGFQSGESPRFAIMRIGKDSTGEALDIIRSAWEEIAPGHPVMYYFLDDRYQTLYESEKRMATIINTFTVLIIFIACLGLFGLAAYTAETRTKEIGIRKVMGASIGNIIALLNKDFLKLVLIGFVIAIPIAWYAMNRWLEDFAYRIEIGPGVFLLAGLMAVLIALATVSWHSMKAAVANPVESLRSE